MLESDKEMKKTREKKKTEIQRSHSILYRCRYVQLYDAIDSIEMIMKKIREEIFRTRYPFSPIIEIEIVVICLYICEVFGYSHGKISYFLVTLCFSVFAHP